MRCTCRGHMENGASLGAFYTRLSTCTCKVLGSIVCVAAGEPEKRDQVISAPHAPQKSLLVHPELSSNLFTAMTPTAHLELVTDEESQKRFSHPVVWHAARCRHTRMWHKCNGKGARPGSWLLGSFCLEVDETLGEKLRSSWLSA